MDPGVWGVEPGYVGTDGQWHEPSPATVEALLGAMGAADAPHPPASGVRVVRPGDQLGGRWRVSTDDGGSLDVEGQLPPDVPFGYHSMAALDGGAHAGAGSDGDGAGEEVTLIVTPGRCHLPEGLSTWGWALQLYALRSRRSWGIGDLADLRQLASWSAGHDAGMVLVNPLHAVLPTFPQQPSPYYASSRCFRSPLYLRVEEVPGAGGPSTRVDGQPDPDLDDLDLDLDRLAQAGRALNERRTIDRDAVWRLKLEALEHLFAARTHDPDFERYRAAGGDALEGWGTFCALAEEHPGLAWSAWPEQYRHPAGEAVARFADRHSSRVVFHCWLQWLVERQLDAAAGSGAGLVQDLAIGVDPAGADAWLWQDSHALDVRVGAPPDAFNTRGQDWGLPPFDPWRLRAAGYEPFIRTVRAGLRAGGGLRFDHVAGLFRLFWIPAGGEAKDGGYVRYPTADLLGILALESVRAGAYVVGEDLGTVEGSMRDELGRWGLLSYRLLWFEPDPPSRWPRQALAAVTTHDLPTVAGMWTGSDLVEQRDLGLAPNEEGTAETRRRLQQLTGVPDDAPVGQAVAATYALLAEAPCAIVTATLDDVLEVEERPNVPGTTDERPNWSLALPMALEDVVEDERVARVSELLRAGRPADR